MFMSLRRLTIGGSDGRDVRNQVSLFVRGLQ
jgi:hypothetical protein